MSPLPVNTMSGHKDEYYPEAEKLSRRGTWLLYLALVLFFLLYLLLALVAPPLDSPNKLFFMIWLLCFLCYFVVCLYVLTSRCPAGWRLWMQLGLILGGAAVFRLLLLPLPLGLSRDAWRYLWDARVLLHGYNPYLYAPDDRTLASLHDFVYANTPYRQFPTKYPPGAELFFALGYLLSPNGLVALKGLFALCDLLTCVALAFLLLRKKLDPRRVIIYAWCPLPIVEFSIQGHLDALVIACTILAIACSFGSSRMSRLLAGSFLGLAILAKLYPVLLLPGLLRRRDWGLLAACAITTALGYLPFLLSSQGQFALVLFSFHEQDTLHPGFLQDMLLIAGRSLNMPSEVMWATGRVMEGVVGVIVVLFVYVQRLRGAMSIAGACLLLIGVATSMYSYLFPWYVPALLPWIAILIPTIPRTGRGLSIKGLALVIVWFSTSAILLVYLPDLR